MTSPGDYFVTAFTIQDLMRWDGAGETLEPFARVGRRVTLVGPRGGGKTPR